MDINEKQNLEITADFQPGEEPCSGAEYDPQGFLRLEHLSKSYLEGSQPRLVLRDTCTSFRHGEFVVILGKSGSGKTTLLNLISGIDRADEGRILFDGVDLTALDDRQRTLFRRKNIGFIFQFYNLIPTLTVWENVLLPLELNHLGQNGGKSFAEDLLREVGLLDRRNTYPDRLSGGEQQRVSIARALVHSPGMVLADEPTGNLDEDTGQSVMQLLETLVRQQNRNLVMVTHNPEAAAHADRTLVLQEGHLVLHDG